MATPIDIVFVGLCTLLNVQNTDSRLPPPSVLVMRHQQTASDPVRTHVAFVAFKTDDLASDGGFTPHPVPGPDTRYQYIELDGVEIELNDDWSGPPTPVSKPDLAIMSVYAKQQLDFDERVVPRPGERPQDRSVGGFVQLGTGAISTARPTDCKWVFAKPGTKGDPKDARSYAREIRYKFHSASASPTLRLRRFDGSYEGNIQLKSQTQALWIGSSPPEQMLAEIDPDQYQKWRSTHSTTHSMTTTATHFAVFYRQLKNAPSDKDMYLPTLAETGCTEVKTPDVGYCGPDGQP